MPFLAQALCGLGTDQAGSADNHDFHKTLHLLRAHAVRVVQ
jgi:hypothetical protein